MMMRMMVVMMMMGRRSGTGEMVPHTQGPSLAPGHVPCMVMVVQGLHILGWFAPPRAQHARKGRESERCQLGALSLSLN